MAGVDHQPFEIEIIRNDCKQSFPHAQISPTEEPVRNALPVAELRWQVAMVFRFAVSKEPHSETIGYHVLAGLGCPSIQADAALNGANAPHFIVAMQV